MPIYYLCRKISIYPHNDDTERVLTKTMERSTESVNPLAECVSARDAEEFVHEVGEDDDGDDAERDDAPHQAAAFAALFLAAKR